MSSTVLGAAAGVLPEMAERDIAHDDPAAHGASANDPAANGAGHNGATKPSAAENGAGERPAPERGVKAPRPSAKTPKAAKPATATRAAHAARRSAQPPGQLTFARHSVASDLHPERNEDALLVDQGRGLAGVFDGVGGSVAGELAARLAVRIIRRGWKQHVDQASGDAGAEGGTEAGAALADLLLQAHHAICAMALPEAPGDERRESGAESAATTAAIAVVQRRPDKRGLHMTCAWVGDSRVYLLPASGHLRRLTLDDGLLTRLVLDGIVSAEDALRVDQAVSPEQLTDLGLSLFNRRNGISQSVGGPHVPEIHVAEAPLHAGDRLLLSTDGIHDNLVDAELEMILRLGARTTVAEAIVACARARSRDDDMLCMRAKPDDMTAVVISAAPRAAHARPRSSR